MLSWATDSVAVINSQPTAVCNAREQRHGPQLHGVALPHLSPLYIVSDTHQLPVSQNTMALRCLQIVIWDGTTGAKVKQLEGHSSYVKGLAWDPVGTYLASQVNIC